jgi:hypothetical protein
MDSLSYPLVNIYVEDDVSKWIVMKAIDAITINRQGFNLLVKPIIVGSAADTYKYFKLKAMLYKEENVNAGYACILDGDMRDKRDRNNNLEYPSEELLFFHHSNDAPERMLLKAYLNTYPNETLRYHLSSNPHRLFEKMIEEGLCGDKNAAFNLCWNALIATPEGLLYIEEMKNFIINACRKFSNDL